MKRTHIIHDVTICLEDMRGQVSCPKGCSDTLEPDCSYDDTIDSTSVKCWYCPTCQTEFEISVNPTDVTIKLNLWKNEPRRN